MTTTNEVRLGKRNAKHAYEVQIAKPYVTITVDADTRSQAAKIARDAGYNVMSVNMVG